MAINIKFDLTGNPETPTIILANRNGNKLGQLKVNEDSIDLSDKLSDASEFTFTVNKYIDNKLTPLWNKIVDFKLVYCKEWDLWFEITVELDEETETVKTVYCTQLGQAELSQIMLYDIEINTEKDIERDDYKISILYDENDPRASILNRTLEKAPHYSIAYVDPTIAKIQRSFSFDSTSILDSHQEIAEEIGCLFVYDCSSLEIDSNDRFLKSSDDYVLNGIDGLYLISKDVDYVKNIKRDIYVYDLQQNCNDCGHRGEFTDKCPKCNSTNIKQGYGEDTLIFVTSDELASSDIELTTDTDSVKNCFKLVAGDDLMTATVRNCNPNGSDYIWYFSNTIKDDMSDELVKKIESYDGVYRDYYDNYKSDINTDLLNDYNKLVEKYSVDNKDLQKISTPITGYSALMNAYYNTIDLSLYLKSGLMPSIEMSETNATEQAGLLTASSLSPVSVNTKNAEAISLATANSAVLSMAKIIVKSTYKVEVKTSTLSDDKIWEGSFVITNYSDETDTAESQTIRVVVNNDVETFTRQKIEKALNKDDTDDYSISGLFKKEYDDFCAELKKYALNPLKSFYDACDSCINILIDSGAGNKDEKPDLYEKLYEPYYKKSSAISAEIKVREDEITIVEGVWDKTDEKNPKLVTKGIQQYIEECRNTIQNTLNFEKYLGEELWLEFCSYRREDTYSNGNYISDGLNNAELFERALEFIEVAENEIYKSSELQHSISTTLNNLLSIDKFKPLVKSFKTGNWIRVQVDDKIFKLRLLEYGIDFGNFDNISVEFSDVTKIKNGVTDVQDILSQASSMATSYSSIQRQASQGSEAKNAVEQWTTEGLNSALVRIQNNNDEEVTLNKNGLLCRSYDDVADAYSPEQFRLTHNIMAYTTDNWQTVSSALGKHNYKYYDSNKIQRDGTDYGLSSKFVTAGYINGSQIIGGEIYSQNYTSTAGTYLNLNDGTFSWAGGKIKYDGTDLKLNGVNLVWTDIEGADTKVTQITKDTVDSAYIKTLNLSVGNEIKMGENATISWSQVTDTDGVATESYVVGLGYQTASQVTQITKDTVTTSYINALKVKAGSVDAENISGTTLSGKTISGGSLNIKDRFIVNTDGNLTAKANADITGKITASSGSITGNLTVTGSLTHTNGDYKVTLRAVQDDKNKGVFYITDKSSGSNVYPFMVSGDGSFTATKATISGDSTFGGTLSAADGTFKGTLSAVSGSFVKLTAGKSTFTDKSINIRAKDGDNVGYVNITDEYMTVNVEGKGYVRIGSPGYTGWEDVTIRPSADAIGNIGTPNYRWDVIYAESGSVSTSDRNKKNEITRMNDEQELLFDTLKPVKYKLNSGKSGRFHYGYISQDIEESLIKLGMSDKDFAGFCKDINYNDDGTIAVDKDGNPEYVYSLRYTEFIALNTHMIQKLQSENKKLKERIDSLEDAIKQLS